MTNSELKIHVRWKEMEKSDDILNYLEEKLTSKLSNFRFVNYAEQIKAEIRYYEREKKFTVRLNVPVNSTKGIVNAEAIKDPQVLSAINSAVEKIVDQLRRIKTQFDNSK